MGSFIDIKLEEVWTSNLGNPKIISFVNTQESVFKNGYTVEKFKKKYLDNIYGESLIILAHVNDKCVGAMAFWRNDIEGKKAFQPCEMAVLCDYRGHGIFSKMNNEGLNYLEKDALLYNFPNDNSLPFYTKSGWVIHSKKRYKIFNPITDSKEIVKIDGEYLEWLFNETNTKNLNFLKYIYLNKKYYLLKERSKTMYVIIGEIDKNGTSIISKARFPILLHYSDKGYFGRGIVTTTRYHYKEIHIPLYKIGPLF